MPNIETKSNLEAAAFSPATPESGVDQETSLNVEKLWHEYGFPGDPPRAGTPVEARLVKNCEQYEKYLSNPRLHGAIGSESIRHQLHDQLATMIFGRSLKILGDEIRDNISNFACRLVTGLDAKQLGDLATREQVEE